MALTENETNHVHVPRPLPHPKSSGLFIACLLSAVALAAALATFAAHFLVVAFLAGLAAVNIGRGALEEIDRSPSLFSGRVTVIAASCVSGVCVGIAGCGLASLVAAAF